MVWKEVEEGEPERVGGVCGMVLCCVFLTINCVSVCGRGGRKGKGNQIRCCVIWKGGRMNLLEKEGARRLGYE